MKFEAIHKHVLHKHHLFTPMDDDQLTTLLRTAHLINLDKGQHLFLQGERADRFYFVVSGQMKLLRLLPDGTEKIIELFRPSQTFAEALMFLAASTYPVNAQAVESTTLFSFSNIEYKKMLLADSNLAIELLGDLSLHLHKRIREIETLSLKNSTIRVVRYILALLDQEDDAERSLELPVAKRLIAAQLAIQPETLSRIFNRMKEDGIVKINGRRLIVTDLGRLERYE